MDYAVQILTTDITDLLEKYKDKIDIINNVNFVYKFVTNNFNIFCDFLVDLKDKDYDLLGVSKSVFDIIISNTEYLSEFNEVDISRIKEKIYQIKVYEIDLDESTLSILRNNSYFITHAWDGICIRFDNYMDFEYCNILLKLLDNVIPNTKLLIPHHEMKEHLFNLIKE